MMLKLAADENFNNNIIQGVLAEARKKAGVKTDTELNAEQWKEVTAKFKKIFKEEAGRDFPQDPIEQIKLSTEAVFKSWNGKRAIDYRNAAHIAHDLGTAVNMVTMVFGNMGNTSGTGVAFTRNPSDDTDEIYGDYLINAQGEDVVAGIRNTEPIVKLGQDLPEAYQEFLKVCRKLEDHYREMQDVEFTIEQGKLWMLQTRDGKRTAKSAIKIGVDMANDGFISKEQAVLRVSPQQVDTLLHPQFDIEAKKSATSEGKLLAKGVNASPGAAVGVVAFDADLAEEWGKKEGKPVIMVRPFTRPDDVHGMLAAKGILTSEGGATSHAAVVARQFGVPCIVGASDVVIDQSRRQFIANSVTVKEGEWVSIDGSTGEAFVGEIPMVSAALEEQEDLQTLLSWADQFRRLQVWANADYPEDAERARSFGAQGIGLCRTEYMFFQEERLPTVQKMILADNDEVRDQALAILLPFQREDFAGLFRAMDGLPVIIRLIDPPLHEFMPEKDEILTEVVTMRAKGETKGLAEKEHLLSAIDQDGVGQLMKMATERGRATRSDLEVGICGEHGGDPESVEFCHRINLNYVSCSPFRVPIARLAAAQAALKEKGVSAK